MLSKDQSQKLAEIRGHVRDGCLSAQVLFLLSIIDAQAREIQLREEVINAFKFQGVKTEKR